MYQRAQSYYRGMKAHINLRQEPLSKIFYKKTKKKVAFSTMAFTAKILSWRFCHPNIAGCLLKRRPTKGGSRAPQDPRPLLRPWPPVPCRTVTWKRGILWFVDCGGVVSELFGNLQVRSRQYFSFFPLSSRIKNEGKSPAVAAELTRITFNRKTSRSSVYKT